MTKPQSTWATLLKDVAIRKNPQELARVFSGFFRGSQDGHTSDQLVQAFEAVLVEWSHLPVASRPAASVLVRAFRHAAAEWGLSEPDLLEKLLAVLVEQSSGERASRHAEGRNTRERILIAAQEVFSHKGFHQATMDEIAERAEVGKGTIYRHFPSKENLFHQLVQIRLKELEAEAERVLDSEDDVLSMIEKYLYIYFAFFDKNQGLYRVMVHEHPDLDERLQDLYVEKIMRRIPRLKRKIRQARLQNVLKDVNFYTVFHGSMGFIHGVIQRWLAQDCSYSLVKELPTVREVLFYGFVNKPKKREEDMSWTSTQ
ncbi:MAG: TetR/AcrR family transcriptional regulator [Desulfosoma sp.]